MARSNSRTSTIGALAVGATALAAGGALVALFARTWRAADARGHDATDLALDKPHPGPGDRAPEAFRPDMDAPMTVAEREAFRPATVPSLVGTGVGVG